MGTSNAVRAGLLFDLLAGASEPVSQEAWDLDGSCNHTLFSGPFARLDKMKRSGSGRVARKIGAHDDDSADSANSSQNEAPPGMKSPSQTASVEF
jgi:hypothetical protein